MDYIRKEDAINAMNKAINDKTWSMSDRDVMESMEEYVEALPTADVAEVVRCKDCKFRKIMSDGKTYACLKQMAYRKPDDFCSYGERKETT